VLIPAIVVASGAVVAVAEPPPPSAADAAPAETSVAKERPRKKRKRRKPRRAIAASVEATAGVLGGEGTVRDGAGFVAVEGKLRPRWERDAVRLELPVTIGDRETVGATFPERRAGVDARVRLERSPALRFSARAGVDGTWRPGWPDPYQPLADGSLAATSRRSHLDGGAGVGVAAIPLRHQHLRAEYDYRHVDYLDDAAYDPIDAPTHLVPGDHDEHALSLDWRHHGDGWKLGGGVDLTHASYAYAYARDAGTGLTHAGAGGPPPNPLQRTLTVEPRIRLDLDGDRADVDLSYGLPVSSDLHEGYYSYVEHHPEVDATIHATRAIELELSAELRWRTYGANSYAVAPPDHPMLDFGTRRSDRTLRSGVEVRVELGGGLAAVGSARLTVRRTNFPDYVPGVFPDSRAYAIDWDYDDVTIAAGLAWSIGSDRDD
jgi:hypothetical protein